MSNIRTILMAVMMATLTTSQNISAQAPVTTVQISADKPGAAISPILNGVFFEDINFAGDGGIYPERIKNRSFEFTDALMGWRKTERGGAIGGLGVLSTIQSPDLQGGDAPLNANNPSFLRITVEQPGAGFGLTNEGFRGIGVNQGAKFTFSAYARSASSEPMTLAIELFDAKNQKIGSGELSGFTQEWKKYSCEIETSATDAKAKITILAKGKGVLDLDMVSLYPKETFNNRPNGLRPDLVQLVKDLKPGFIRFPGGCIVEGRILSNRYRWKDTIGDVAERKLIINRWNTEFAHKNAPDYFQSFGLGFFEYFQLCEDVGAKPLPILNCGMACQYNSGELCPIDKLDEYIQDALDLIEFANGPATSTWGAKRAAMGHPEPFGLTMLGIGNEQWGPQYFDRYVPIAKAVRAKYPEIKLISGTGPSPDGRDFNYAWERLRRLDVDLVDEHYYKDPAWFLSQTKRYDKYDRKGPKVFAGEFAAHTKGRRNNWEAGIAEAAFRTGLERNADVVEIASYAPLFAHVDAWQWGPDMIWFDNLRSFGTPSYYVQKMFADHTGSHVVPVAIEGAGDDLFACASRDEKSGAVIVKIVNNQAAARSVRIALTGVGNLAEKAAVETLASEDLNIENTLDEPKKFVPKSSTISIAGAEFDFESPAKSLAVITLPQR